MQILNRSELRLLVEGRPLIVSGEALLSGHGGPNFVVFTRERIRWEDGAPFDETQRPEIFGRILLDAPAHGLEIEVSGPWAVGEADEIRVARPADAGIVSSILTEAARWIRAEGQPLWADEKLTPERVLPECEHGRFHLALERGEPVGTVRLTLEDPAFWPEAAPGEAAYVHRIAVRRSVASSGTSASLLAFAGEFAAAHGARFVRLDCMFDRPRLRAFYERQGFAYHSDRVVHGAHVARYERRVGESDR